MSISRSAIDTSEAIKKIAYSFSYQFTTAFGITKALFSVPLFRAPVSLVSPMEPVVREKRVIVDTAKNKGKRVVTCLPLRSENKPHVVVKGKYLKRNGNKPQLILAGVIRKTKKNI